jgi:hypothetical protein
LRTPRFAVKKVKRLSLEKVKTSISFFEKKNQKNFDTWIGVACGGAREN